MLGAQDTKDLEINQSKPLVAPGTQQMSTLGVDTGAPPRATPKGILGVPWRYLYPRDTKLLDQGRGKYNLRVSWGVS